MLRILFVTTTYPLHPGDAIPGFVADLARSLVHEHGAQIKVIAPHHPGAAKSETVDGVRIERFQYTLDPSKQCLAYGNGIPDNIKNFPQAKWQIPGFFAAMAAAVRRNLDDTDLIHAHWVEPAFIASLANFAHRKPLVLTVHSLKPKPSRLHRHTLAIVDRVLFNSEYTMAQAMAKEYRCRGQVIYQGYNDALFGMLPRSGEARESLGIPTAATVVTAVGRMIEVKGMHILAAAADRILAMRPDIHLVFAGDGPSRPEVESIVARSRHRDRIHFPGALTRRQVAQLLAESDLFVNPGVIDRNGRAEGLGITTIEAMASGLPVVGSRVGGIVETIVDGVTGILVPPGATEVLAASVGNLLNDPTSRERMGRAGQTIARDKFTWPSLSAQVMRVYNEVR
jgi:glycosyltransferase involved in cell wall biosynthesis